METAPSMQGFIAAHRHSSNHRAELIASDRCGCFYCLTIFTPKAITDWVDGPAGALEGHESTAGTTAICPLRGIDSVIGSASGYPMTAEFLQTMHTHWFQA